MTQWYVIEKGWGAGEARLEGWIEDSIEGVRDTLRFGICPLCAAMVPISEIHGNKTWGHERWHAATDFPIPAEVRERLGAQARTTTSLEERVHKLERAADAREDYEMEMRDRGE